MHMEIKALGIQETVQLITMKNWVLIKSQRLFLIGRESMKRKKVKLKSKDMSLKACMEIQTELYPPAKKKKFIL